MHSVLPNAKLVYILRDPVEHVVSHYIDAYSFGRVHRPLDDVLDEDEGRHYIACSKYFFQLEQYLPFYAPERILVVQTEALATRRLETLSRIFEFLDADPAFIEKGSPASSINAASIAGRTASALRLSSWRSVCDRLRSGAVCPPGSHNPSTRSTRRPRGRWPSRSSRLLGEKS